MANLPWSFSPRVPGYSLRLRGLDGREHSISIRRKMQEGLGSDTVLKVNPPCRLEHGTIHRFCRSHGQ